MATETPHYRLKKPGQDDFYNVADANGNMDILDNVLFVKADLDPGTGKVKPEQLPPIDVSGQIATHNSSGNPHANMNFLRYVVGEPVPPLPDNADTLEHRTLAQIQEEFRGAFSGALAPKAHAASHKTGGADALTPGDIGAASKLYVDGNFTRMITGSYVGTGVYGPSNPNSLLFPFAPKLLQIPYARGKSGECYLFGTDAANPQSTATSLLALDAISTEYTNYRFSGYEPYAQYSRVKKSADGKTVFWYGDQYQYSHLQFNQIDCTYFYVAFG